MDTSSLSRCITNWKIRRSRPSGPEIAEAEAASLAALAIEVDVTISSEHTSSAMRKHLRAADGLLVVARKRSVR